MTKHAEKQALDKKKQDDLAEKDEEVYEDVVKALPLLRGVVRQLEDREDGGGVRACVRA